MRMARFLSINKTWQLALDPHFVILAHNEMKYVYNDEYIFSFSSRIYWSELL